MKILVLAGGFDQIALIRELKKNNCEVLLADYFENPPAKHFADSFFQISTLDEEAIFQLAKGERVDLITTACTDQALLTVARVSERLGLPCYIDSATARNVTDKAFMKQIFKKYEIPTANSVTLNEGFDTSILEAMQYPLVVKPCDCNSSKGVIRVENDIERDSAIENAFKLSRSRQVIVENYLVGEEVSIDVWKDNQGAKVLSVSGTSKIEGNEDCFTIYQSRYPIEMSDVLIDRIQYVADRIALAFNLNNCPILIQGMVYGDEISVIEFSARMGGGSKYKLIEYMSGVEIMKAYVNRVLGDETQIISPKWSSNKIEIDYVYAHNGTYEKLVNFEELKNKGEIEELFVYKMPGSIIEKHTTSSDRVLGFLIQSASEDGLIEKRKKIIDEVGILDVEGRDIMFRDCF